MSSLSVRKSPSPHTVEFSIRRCGHQACSQRMVKICVWLTSHQADIRNFGICLCVCVWRELVVRPTLCGVMKTAVSEEPVTETVVCGITKILSAPEKSTTQFTALRNYQNT